MFEFTELEKLSTLYSPFPSPDFRVTANIANKVSNSELKLNVTVTNSYLCSLDISALMTIYLKTYVSKFTHFPVMSMLWPDSVFMRIFPVRNYKFPRQPCSTSC